MRRGVWVVLGLMGLAPVGALAEGTQGQHTEQTRKGSQARTQGLSQEEMQRQLTELRKDINALHRDVATMQSQSGSASEASATGGSGQTGAASATAPAAGNTGQETTAPAAEDTGVPTGNVSVFGPVGSATGGSGAGVGTPTGTQAQSGMAATDETDNSGILLEIPQGGIQFPGIVGARRSQATAACPVVRGTRKAAAPATGGSGRGGSASSWSDVPNAEVFVGFVRTVTPDRLVMEGPNQRIYEFGLPEQLRVYGPTGSRSSLMALREGTPVRTLTLPGAFENQVIILQTLEQQRPKWAPAQRR